MSDRIFFIGDNDELHAMSETPYLNEDIFQQLLAKYPDLLSGDQGDVQSPAWLLIKREMSIADREDGEGRWSLDHLFLDPDGIPTLVEVKRSSDTRLRREVVGQMLDYAANAVLYWPVSKLRAEFEASCENQGNDSDTVLCEFLSKQEEGERESVTDEFWMKVKTNLEAEKIRLIFVADNITSELARIVEFLNGQMDPAEVIALELKQFTSDSLRTLVPRVFGHTSRADRKKLKKRRTTPWTEQELLNAIEENAGPEKRRLAADLIGWGKQHGDVVWGKGPSVGHCYILEYAVPGKTHAAFSVMSTAKVELGHAKELRTPDFRAIVASYIEKLNMIDGFDLPPVDDFYWKTYSLDLLKDPKVLAYFKKTVEEFTKAVAEKVAGMDAGKEE